MRRFIAASLLSFFAACTNTGVHDARLKSEIQKALPKFPVVTWAEVDFKCNGRPSIFVISDGNGYSNLNILDRSSGNLFSRFQDSLSYRDDPKRKISRIIQTDIGKDGCIEVELFQMNGERRIYAWNGAMYVRADTNIRSRDKDSIYYRDLDGDGTEETIVVHTPDNPELFRAYKWQRGWIPYRPKELEHFDRDYKSFDNARLDALALTERRETVIRQLLAYLK